MSTLNNYTANNSSVKDVILDQVETHRSQGMSPTMAIPYGDPEKHSYFKCTACYWDKGELITCPKCQKFKEEWDKLNNITTMEHTPEIRLTKAQQVQELFGCVIYVFGIVAAFVLLIWSTM